MTDSLRTLGLAKKAGALLTGEENVGGAAREKKAKLILTARDCPENVKKRANGFSILSGAPWAELPYDRDKTGQAVGKPRTSILTVTDTGLSAAFMRKLNAECGGKYEGVSEALSQKAQRALKRKGVKKAAESRARTGKRRT